MMNAMISEAQAVVVISHGINASIVSALAAQAARTQANAFVPVTLDVSALDSAPRIAPEFRVESHHANGTIVVKWPLHGCGTCFAWG